MILGNSSHIHSSCFYEIDQAVSELQKERGDDRVVCFNSHNYPWDIPKGAIVFNLDFPGIHFSEEWYKRLVDKYEVWDHCKLTADKFGTKHVPVGYHTSMKRFERESNPEIDIAFFGSPNPRRIEILKRLSDAGLSIYASDTAYREERDEVLSKCKLSLNILFYENPGIFPILRAAHCWANKVPIFNEKSLEAPWWSINYPYDRLISTISYFLEEDMLSDLANWDYEDFTRNEMVLP